MATHPMTAAPRARSFTGFALERATFERHKADLLARAEGQYVVIVGDDLVGPLPTAEEAERAGYARFGLGPLYVRQVLAEEPAALVTRGLTPCPT